MNNVIHVVGTLCTTTYYDMIRHLHNTNKQYKVIAVCDNIMFDMLRISVLFISQPSCVDLALEEHGVVLDVGAVVQDRDGGKHGTA